MPRKVFRLEEDYLEPQRLGVVKEEVFEYDPDSDEQELARDRLRLAGISNEALSLEELERMTVNLDGRPPYAGDVDPSTQAPLPRLETPRYHEANVGDNVQDALDEGARLDKLTDSGFLVNRYRQLRREAGKRKQEKLDNLSDSGE